MIIETKREAKEECFPPFRSLRHTMRIFTLPLLLLLCLDCSAQECRSIAKKAEMAFSKKNYAKAADLYFAAMKCAPLEAGKFEPKMIRASRQLARRAAGKPQSQMLEAPSARAAYNLALAAAIQRKDTLLAWSIARYNFESHPQCAAALYFFSSLSSDPRLWPENIDRLPCFHHGQAVSSVCFSPDGKSVLSVSLDSTIRIWDLNGDEQWRYTHQACSLTTGTLSPDLRYMLAGSRDGELLWIPYHLPADELKQLVSLESTTKAPVEMLVSSHYGEFTQQYPPSRSFQAHLGAVYSISFKPDGSGDFLTAGKDGCIRVWKMNTGEHQLWIERAGVRTAAYTPFQSTSGPEVLTMGTDSIACLWDPAGRLMLQFDGHARFLTSAVFSPDGRFVMTTGADSVACIWDVNGRLLSRLAGHNGTVFCGAFAPDGTLAVTGCRDHLLRVWDVRTGELLQTFAGHTGAVYTVAFSPDGRKIVSGSADGTVRIWRLGVDCIEHRKGPLSLAELRAAGVQLEPEDWR